MAQLILPIRPRRERREDARKEGYEFEPQYNGPEPKSYKEMFGIGYERFDSKYVKVSEGDK